jgi:glycosyltransferase involved in cell wall biosynthesis
MIGTDETSRGGIAGVASAIHRESQAASSTVEIRLLKTCHYMDRNRFWEIIQFFKAFSAALAVFAGGKVDIAHIHASAWVSFARKSVFVLLARLFRITVIIHLHSSDFSEFFAQATGIRFFLMRTILRRARAVIVLCDEWQRVLEEKYGVERIAYIPNPLTTPIPETAEFRECSSASRPVFLFMGFLIESKGIRDLVRIAERARERRIDIRICVAGKGELAEWLAREIERLGLSEMIQFVGWVEPRQKDALFRRSSVLLLPSYKEGMPIAVLEAMAHALPVLSTRIAGIPNQVIDGYNGFLFDPGDIEGFVDAIERLATDPALRQTMSSASVEKAREFAPDKVFKLIVDLYTSVVPANVLAELR